MRVYFKALDGKEVFCKVQKLQDEYTIIYRRAPTHVEMTEDEFDALKEYLKLFISARVVDSPGWCILGMQIVLKND